MIVKGDFKFMGCEARPGFKDPSKVNYVLGLAQGLDNVRLYIDAFQYGEFSKIAPYSDVSAELNYNPVAEKAAYAMRLQNLTLKEG